MIGLGGGAEDPPPLLDDAAGQRGRRIVEDDDIDLPSPERRTEETDQAQASLEPVAPGWVEIPAQQHSYIDVAPGDLRERPREDRGNVSGHPGTVGHAAQLH